MDWIGAAVTLIVITCGLVSWRRPCAIGVGARDRSQTFLAMHHGRIIYQRQFIELTPQQHGRFQFDLREFDRCRVNPGFGRGETLGDPRDSSHEKTIRWLGYTSSRAIAHVFYSYEAPTDNISASFVRHARSAPAWPLMAMGCVPLALDGRRALQSRRRRRAGLCANCAYDLRATSGRCPECGAVPIATA